METAGNTVSEIVPWLAARRPVVTDGGIVSAGPDDPIALNSKSFDFGDCFAFPQNRFGGRELAATLRSEVGGNPRFSLVVGTVEVANRAGKVRRLRSCRL
jgi:hypothetical protein